MGLSRSLRQEHLQAACLAPVYGGDPTPSPGHSQANAGAHPVSPQLLQQLKSYERACVQILDAGDDDPFINIGERHHPAVTSRVAHSQCDAGTTAL